MATNIVGSDTSTHTRLQGNRLHIFRIGWIVIVLMAIVLYLSSLPGYVENRSSVCDRDIDTCMGAQLTPEVAETLQEYGIKPLYFALFFVFMDSSVLIVYSIVASFIFWRRSDDWMALLVSLQLMMMGVSFGPELSFMTINQPIIRPLTSLIIFIGFGLLPVVFYLFPDGRFVPRWAAWLTPFGLALVAYFILTETFVYQSTPFFLALGLGMVTSFIAQVIRYRNYATPIQRQQTKWVIFVYGLAFVWVFIGISPVFVVPSLINSFLFHSIRVPFFTVIPISLIGIGIANSLLRYRLWDVDFVINRSLIYGALTLFLMAIFAAVFLALQAVLTTILGSNQIGIAAGIAGVLIAVLFNPTRQRISHFVDRRFYGIQIDVDKPAMQANLLGSSRTHFGDFANLEPIGSGGMADIYRAQHPAEGKTVAIKVLPERLADKEEFRRRFEREAQVVLKLTHPNIVNVFDYGETEGSAYMVMDYLSGGDLSDLLRKKGRFAFDDALAILEDVAAALDYAHEQGIVHRDVKPSNVMLEAVDDAEKSHRAILTDFGIARIYAAITELTGTGGIVGTMEFIAPEQIQGVSDIDRRADIYSLGVMAYQMLTGNLPFKKGNVSALLMAHLMQPPPDATEIVPELPQSAADAIMQAMAKQRDDRFATAGEMIQAMKDD